MIDMTKSSVPLEEIVVKVIETRSSAPSVCPMEGWVINVHGQ